MPAGPAADAPLPELYARLAGGVLDAAQRSRDPGAARNDENERRRPPSPALRALWTLHDEDEPLASDVEAAVDAAAAWLAGDRTALRAILHHPHEQLAKSVDVPGADDEREHWARLCLVAEAAWRSLSTPGADPMVAGRLRPLAARFRFLAFSEPFRYRRAAGTVWLPDREPGGQSTEIWMAQVFGPRTADVLLRRAREARADWAACLDARHSHAFLAGAEPEEVEAELDALVAARGYRSGRLKLILRDLAEYEEPQAEDRAIGLAVAERHLLPRFRVLAVAALCEPTQWVGYLLLYAAVAGCLGAVAVAAGGGHFGTAALSAAMCYALIAAGAIGLGPLWAAQWLLRLPAAAAVGLVALVALPDWWQRARLDSPTHWWAFIALAGVAWGYLVIEGRNHGLSASACLRRSTGVAAVGLVHGFLVSLIGLVVVAPAFAEEDAARPLSALWTGAGGDPWAVLLLSSAWCLAIGVFSQILWDDRPITAPLRHL
ncbi:hypothetical protein [Marinactinospora rubrisoli]|uniref:Uncharacterized protein n=1 Tax=Marinactinospora rubrisoli TaxID=2715399 RepID=A0ABW2KM68_9ACTN